jgi:hypothetical protein
MICIFNKTAPYNTLRFINREPRFTRCDSNPKLLQYKIQNYLTFSSLNNYKIDNISESNRCQ